MPEDTSEKIYDLIVLLLTLSVPFLLASLWVLYRLVRGHRWRQREILHTNIAILQTNQAILNALMSAIPKERRPRNTPVPRAAEESSTPAPEKKGEAPAPRLRAKAEGQVNER